MASEDEVKTNTVSKRAKKGTATEKATDLNPSFYFDPDAFGVGATSRESFWEFSSAKLGAKKASRFLTSLDTKLSESAPKDLVLPGDEEFQQDVQSESESENSEDDLSDSDQESVQSSGNESRESEPLIDGLGNEELDDLEDLSDGSSSDDENPAESEVSP